MVEYRVVEKVCGRCGKTFTMRLRPQSRPRAYCSGACRQAAWWKKAKEEYVGSCAICGVPVEYPHKTCSRECRDVTLTRGQTTDTYEIGRAHV